MWPLLFSFAGGVSMVGLRNGVLLLLTVPKEGKMNSHK